MRHELWQLKSCDRLTANLIPDYLQPQDLHSAASSGDIIRVQEILAGTEGREAINTLDGAGLAPLHYAVAMGHCAVAAALLEAGAELEGESRFDNKSACQSRLI